MMLPICNINKHFITDEAVVSNNKKGLKEHQVSIRAKITIILQEPCLEETKKKIAQSTL